MKKDISSHTHHRNNLSRWNFNPEHLCPKYKNTHICKRNLTQLKSHIKPHTLTVGDFNTLLLSIDRSTRQKPNREIRELSDVMTQMNLADIYRTFYPNTKEYTFFSAPHGTFSKIDHMLGNKENLNRYKKLE